LPEQSIVTTLEQLEKQDDVIIFKGESMAEVKKNVFISHHHKDDASVDGLTKMLAGKGYHLRNSSVRIRPGNQDRIDKKQVSDNTIKRLLRMKMRWAGQLIVVVGKETSTRPWVNWEIEAAHKLGKPIIGVYENGLKDQVDLPDSLSNYATSIVGWRSESVIKAIDGEGQFQNPDGSPAPKMDGGYVTC